MVSVPLSGDWNALSTGEENSNISRVQESLGEDDELDRGLGLDRLPRFFPFFFFFSGDVQHSTKGDCQHSPSRRELPLAKAVSTKGPS